MTDFRYPIKSSTFKLGIVERTDTGFRPFGVRDLSYFQKLPSEEMVNKPIIMPKQPEPNIFFTPIKDNRNQILEMMKRELELQLEVTKLPLRY